MALDFNKVRSRLDQLQSKGKKNADGSFEKIDFKKVYWKPRLGKQTIRLVPFKTNPSEPCLEVYYHNNIVKKKMLALTNWGEKDPIVEFTDKLKASAEKDDRDFGYKLSPKKKYLFQVVERGQEHLGTRLWEASKVAAADIYAIIANEDYGDILDVNSGVDLEIDGVEDSFNNIKYIKPTILPKRKSSPLAKTEEEINNFLNNQYDPLKLTKKYSFQELKGFLEQCLNADEEGEATESETEETEEAVNETPSEELPFIDTPGEETEEEVGEEAGEEESSDVDEDTPPFEVEVPVAQSAIAKASKRIIAKNNAEIAAAAAPKKEETVPKIKKATTTKAATKTVTTTSAAPAAGGQSNKEKFAALFGKK